MTTYLASYVQDLTAQLGPDANLPPFCPLQMSPQQGSIGWVPPPQGSQPPPGWTTLGLPATSVVDDSTAGLSATIRLDATAGLPATFGLDGPAGIPATSGVDASYSTQLQPVDAITSSALWIT
ncbi:hypothetical protein U9M48_002260, partial [Paspalum notatum var. saurae]